jgi:hypothetical protein
MRKFNTIWPLPVYVATFSDGEVVRLSFGSHFVPAAAAVLRVVRGSRKPAYEQILAALPELTFAQLEELERVLGDVINEKLAA